jgi:hypothetical protein
MNLDLYGEGLAVQIEGNYPLKSCYFKFRADFHSFQAGVMKRFARSSS